MDNISSPSNPPANHLRLFFDADNSDHLTILNASGTETDLQAASGGGNTVDIQTASTTLVTITTTPTIISAINLTTVTPTDGFILEATLEVDSDTAAVTALVIEFVRDPTGSPAVLRAWNYDLETGDDPCLLHCHMAGVGTYGGGNTVGVRISRVGGANNKTLSRIQFTAMSIS